MHKTLCCACSWKFLPPFPLLLSRCNVNPSLLLGLCLYKPFSLLIVVYYFLLPGFICICCLLFLSHTLSCCGTQLLITHCSVVGLVSTVCDGSWICCSCCCYLIISTCICLCSPYFFHLLSCVLVVAVCHIIFLHFCHPFALTLLIVVSFLLATNEQSLLHFPLSSSSSSTSMYYTLSLRVPPSPLGSIASYSLTIIEQVC